MESNNVLNTNQEMQSNQGMQELKIELGDCVLVKSYSDHELAAQIAHVVCVWVDIWGFTRYTLLDVDRNQCDASIEDIECIINESSKYCYVVDNKLTIKSNITFKECINDILNNKMHKKETKIYPSGEIASQITIIRMQDEYPIWGISVK